MGKFRVGDCVRIRQWDDMKNEFGVDSNGDINKHPSPFPAEDAK